MRTTDRSEVHQLNFVKHTWDLKFFTASKVSNLVILAFLMTQTRFCGVKAVVKRQFRRRQILDSPKRWQRKHMAGLWKEVCPDGELKDNYRWSLYVSQLFSEFWGFWAEHKPHQPHKLLFLHQLELLRFGLMLFVLLQIYPVDTPKHVATYIVLYDCDSTTTGLFDWVHSNVILNYI